MLQSATKEQIMKTNYLNSVYKKKQQPKLLFLFHEKRIDNEYFILHISIKYID